MPNRIIKDSINESLGLSECSVFAEDLYKRLITYADDYGRFNADTTIMRARLYPREYESVTEQDIIEALVELSGVRKIEFYEPEVFNQFGKRGIYGAFPNWSEHQRVRESKKKCPEPGDTKANDWYLRRFIPIDMKAQILERDNFKCQLCGKFVTTCKNGKRFAKLGSGLYNIDYIVPVLQGGRATLENLRITCPSCNKSRKRKLTFADVLAETLAQIGDEKTEFAESCGNLPQNSAIIQSESESESNPKNNSNELISRVSSAWNALGLSQITKISGSSPRGKMLKARIMEYGEDAVFKAIDNIRHSSFLRGQNDRGWTITFDWFVKPSNFVKVLEGNYTDKTVKTVEKRNGVSYGGEAKTETIKTAYLRLCEEMGEDPESVTA